MFCYVFSNQLTSFYLKHIFKPTEMDDKDKVF